MNQMMYFEPECRVAARNPTCAVVAMLNRGAGAGRHHILGATN